jgi:hypothetical protein
MKKSQAILAAFALATAFGAQAKDISNPVETLTFDSDNSVFFGQKFGSKNGGNTFTDKYQFTTSVAGTLTGDVWSIGGNDKQGLSITDFSLFDNNGKLLTANQLSSGQTDNWALSYANLSAGSYYVQISGTALGNGASKYTADLSVSPVPEPESYAMMLAGLGLVGFAARRTKK